MVSIRYVAIAVLCIVAFLVGVFFGYQLDPSSADLLDATETTFQSLALEYSLVSTYDASTCAYLASRQSDLVEQLSSIGRVLAKTSDTSPNFSYLKRKYHVQQARAYIQSLKLSQLCSISTPTVLFFYDAPQASDAEFSNTSYYNLSQEQGLILDGIVSQYGESNVSVYAIEYGYVPELSFLEAYYNITAAPSLIVNFNTVFVGLTSAKAVERVLWIS